MTLLQLPEFWVAVGFVAVIGVLAWQGVPALVGRLLDARAAAIKAELDEAKRLRNEAAVLLRDYTAKAAMAEKEAGAIALEAKAEAERFAAEAQSQLRAQIERRMQVAQERIAQAEVHAMAEIRAAAADAAAAAAEKLIAARLDEARTVMLIEKSIGELSDKLN